MTLILTTISSIEDPAICNIIKTVGAEFGAIGEGFGPSDPEVLAMSQYYRLELNSRYFIAKLGDEIVGGAGIAPFNGSDKTCELKKLFLLPQARGQSIGQKLAQACLSFATEQGFSHCYLDTLSNMQAAIRLYENLGFIHLNQPLEGTEHNGCDVWMLKTLSHD